MSSFLKSYNSIDDELISPGNVKDLPSNQHHSTRNNNDIINNHKNQDSLINSNLISNNGEILSNKMNLLNTISPQNLKINSPMVGVSQLISNGASSDKSQYTKNISVIGQKNTINKTININTYI